MAIWVAMLVGLVFGSWGGLKAFRHAKRDEFDLATRWVRIGGLSAALVAMITVWLLLGWPFLSTTVTIEEEVTETVEKTVMVPVEVTWWFFWTDEEMQPETRTFETITTNPHSVEEVYFSFLMLIMLGLVGLFAYCSEFWVLRFMWRFFG